MLRAVLDKRLICAAFFPFGSSSGQVSDGKMAEISPTSVTMDKLKNIMLDENGYPTKELQSVLNATFVGTVSGFFLGGIGKTRSLVETHKSENLATLYENKYEAFKQLHIKTGSNFIKGGLPVAVKLGLFCFMFTGISTGLHIYRGKFDMLNHICGGAVTGFLFKINMGLKGAFAGTVLGTILGIISGFITSFLLFVTGSDINSVYEAGNKLAYARRNRIKELSKTYRDEEDERLKRMYETNKNINAMFETQQRKE